MTRFLLRCCLSALALVLAGCSRAAAPTTTVTTLPPPPPTTTTLPAPLEVTVRDAPPGLARVVQGLYRFALGEQPNPPAMPPAFRRVVAGAEVSTRPPNIRATATVGKVGDARVGVVTAGDDVVLAVEEQGWRIVGGELASLGIRPYYGGSPRLVMVIGSDARPGQNPPGFRADSLHIVGIAPQRGEAGIVGIPRDSWIEASYGGRNKITNMMASRGPEVIVDTVEQLTGLDLEGYVLAGFEGFVNMLDDFGPFELDVPFAMNAPKAKAFFEAGVQMFSGADALAFSRNRTLPGGDLTRSFHQGVVMQAVLAHARAGGVSRLPGMVEAFAAHGFTDLDPAQLLTLGYAAFAVEDSTNVVAPATIGTAGAASVVYLTDEAFLLFDDLADGVLEPVEE